MSFGTGADGSHTVSGIESATGDMNFTDLIVPAGSTYKTNQWRIFVSGRLFLYGNIQCNGNDGGNGGAGVDGGNGTGGFTNNTNVGTAGLAVSAGYFGAQKAGVVGGQGGACGITSGSYIGSNGVVGNAGLNATLCSFTNTSAGGASGNGYSAYSSGTTYASGGSGKSGGAVGATTSTLTSPSDILTYVGTAYLASGSGSGAGGAGGGSRLSSFYGGQGGAGGGSGSDAGILYLSARKIYGDGTISANGGNGGAGGAGGSSSNAVVQNGVPYTGGGPGGGGGGGGAGYGGIVYLEYAQKTYFTGTISANGGTGGNGGNGGNFGSLAIGYAGSSGSNGGSGLIILNNSETITVYFNALSKNTTYKKMMDILRPRMNMFLDWKLSDSLLIKEINDAVSRYYAGLPNKKRYITRYTFDITGSANPYSVDLSSLNPFPSKIDTVIYTGDGRVPIRMLSQVELESVSSLSSVNANSVFGAIDGQSLSLVFGSDVTIDTSASVEVVVLRQPDTTANEAGYILLYQYLDVADEDIDSVIDMVCNNMTYYRN